MYKKKYLNNEQKMGMGGFVPAGICFSRNKKKNLEKLNQ